LHVRSVSKNELAFRIVAAGVAVVAWTQHGSVRWILGGVFVAISLIWIGRELLAIRTLRSSANAELTTASDDELLTTWKDFHEFTLPRYSRSVRRSVARRQQAIERELRSRGIVPPEGR
jgi:hypothetical protein